MNKKEIVESIIIAMTDDDKKNIRILKIKLIIFLNTILSLKDFVSLGIYENNTYRAIKAYLSLCDQSKRNDLIMEKDENGNNFLHIAIRNNFSIDFIYKCINLVKYVLEPYQLITPFINQVNRNYLTLLHEILYQRPLDTNFWDQINIKSTKNLFKTLLDLGFNYKLDDINGDDILSLIEAAHNKAQRKAINGELNNRHYQSVKNMTTEMEKCIFCLEYEPIFEKLTDFNVFSYASVFEKSPYKYNINQEKFFSVFEYDSFRILKSIESGLNDNKITISNDDANDTIIIRIIKMAIESGFNVNCKPTIMRHVLEHAASLSFKDIYFIYSLLCNHGYITYDADFTEDDLIKCIGSVKNDNSDEYMDKLKPLYQQQRFISLLTLVLGNRGLKVDDNFILKYNNCYMEFNTLWSDLQKALGVTDDGCFANIVINDIAKKREQCLNAVDNDISIEEMICSLVSLFENLNHSIQSTINNVKIKMLNN